MPPGGWEELGKACPGSKCNGELLIKALGAKHLAVRCTHCDQEKRGREREMVAWAKNPEWNN